MYANQSNKYQSLEWPVLVVVKPYGHHAKISDPIYDELDLECTIAELTTECRREYGLFIAIEVEVRKAPEGK